MQHVGAKQQLRIEAEDVRGSCVFCLSLFSKQMCIYICIIIFLYLRVTIFRVFHLRRSELGLIARSKALLSYHLGK